MDPTRLAPEPASGEKKQQAMQDAKDMYKHTVRTCEKLNIPIPPYDFLELIGKGGSGRVYKCRDRKTGDLAAVKIVDTDLVDYNTDVFDKDNTIADFQKEVATLQKLKESQAQNINIIHNAYEIGQNLWIVSDYCTGGSVRTLMRALPPSTTSLEEHYIIPIARELLVAMVGLHDMGIIHRDIKATNVYITETGALQLGDYGVVGVTDEQTSKRRTILGTPHWMPRELLNPTQGDQTFEGYGAEIDVWAFGCTLFEMATGAPPNARLPFQGLARALLRAPRLEGEQHSEELRDFVAFCLNSDPQQRPTAQAALQHPYVANTQKKYPTSSLVKLIERYKLWEYGGGIRQSLFLHGGAPDIPSQVGSEEPQEDDDDNDWNFSTSDSFNTDFERRYSHMLNLDTVGLDLQLDAPHGAGLPPGNMSNWDRLQAEWREQQADRGGESLARLYRLSAAEYKLHTPMTEVDEKKPFEDLPLRSSTQDTEAQESVLDLDEAQYDPNAAPFNFDFLDSTTLKARKSRHMSSSEGADDEDEYSYSSTDNEADKRATMEWTFPSTSKKVISPKRATMDWTFASARAVEPDEPDAKMELPPPGDGDPPPAFRPTLKHTQTMPLGEAGDYIHPSQSFRPSPGPATSPIRDSMASMIDLDMGGLDMNENVRPATALQSFSPSRDRDSMASMIDLDAAVDYDTDASRPGTAISTTGSHFSDMTSGNPFDLEEDPGQNERDRDRFSYHKQWQSEGGHIDQRNSARKSIPMHTRGSSLSSTDNETIDRRSNGNGLRYHLEEPQIGLRKGSVDDGVVGLDSWPNFDQPGIERVSSNEAAGSHSRQQPSTASSISANERPGPRKVAFPAITGPSVAALEEHASTALLAAELESLCGALAEGLGVAARALEVHAGLEEGETGVSGQHNDGMGQGVPA